MNTGFVMGQYVYGTSFLHRLDPRLKFISAIAIMVLIFLAATAAPVALISSFIVFVVITSRIPLRLVLKTLRPIMWLLIIAFIINLFAGGQFVLWQYKFIVIYREALYRAALFTWRFVAIIVSTSLFLALSTTPNNMANALESLLKPLKFFRVPVSELAMMMSIALRFVPTLLMEAETIMKAQSARGAHYDIGNAWQRAKGVVSIVVPLFVSSFRRADDLAIAMESRCYTGVGRTKLNPLKFTKVDMIFVPFLLLLVAATIVLQYFV